MKDFIAWILIVIYYGWPVLLVILLIALGLISFGVLLGEYR